MYGVTLQALPVPHRYAAHVQGRGHRRCAAGGGRTGCCCGRRLAGDREVWADSVPPTQTTRVKATVTSWNHPRHRRPGPWARCSAIHTQTCSSGQTNSERCERLPSPQAHVPVHRRRETNCQHSHHATMHRHPPSGKESHRTQRHKQRDHSDIDERNKHRGGAGREQRHDAVQQCTSRVMCRMRLVRHVGGYGALIPNHIHA